MEKNEKIISVMIADDHLIFAQGLKRIIEISAHDISVQYIANCGLDLINQIEKFVPDVILLDIRMPGIDGVETTKIIHKKYPQIKILILTTFNDEEYVRRAVEFGASGFLLKDISPEELFNSIRTIHDSPFVISTAIMEKITLNENNKDKTQKSNSQSHEDEVEIYQKLTERENQVLNLLINQYDNQSIADELCISERTVRNYVSSIYSKLNIENRLKLIRIFRKEE